jgi:hypothetical protein
MIHDRNSNEVKKAYANVSNNWSDKGITISKKT